MEKYRNLSGYLWDSPTSWAIDKVDRRDWRPWELFGSQKIEKKVEILVPKIPIYNQWLKEEMNMSCTQQSVENIHYIQQLREYEWYKFRPKRSVEDWWKERAKDDPSIIYEWDWVINGPKYMKRKWLFSLFYRLQSFDDGYNAIRKNHLFTFGMKNANWTKVRREWILEKWNVSSWWHCVSWVGYKLEWGEYFEKIGVPIGNRKWLLEEGIVGINSYWDSNWYFVLPKRTWKHLFKSKYACVDAKDELAKEVLIAREGLISHWKEASPFVRARIKMFGRSRGVIWAYNELQSSLLR